MGLDASVRCNCFEKGLLKDPPVPVDDLYINTEGYLSSRMLDKAYKEMDYRRYQARFGKIREEFEDWVDTACEHECGDICTEWVSNISGCAHFRMLVEEAGGEHRFPLLSKLLPQGNGGIYPAEKAKTTLEELNNFISAITDIDEWVLCDVQTEEIIWTSPDKGRFTWRYDFDSRVGMEGGKVFFEKEGKPTVYTTHFRQIPFGKPDKNGCQPMQIECLDINATAYTFDSIGSCESDKAEREFIVFSKKAPFLYEGKYGIAERLKNLLEASLETSNPIRWC